MAAGGEPFGMARRGTRLTNLIHVSHETEDGLIFAALIDEGFAATEGGSGFAQEIQNESFGLLRMDLAIGLFFGPASAGNEEQIRVGTNRLRIGLWSANASDGGAPGLRRKRDGEFLNGDGRRSCMPGFMAAGIEQENPRASFALEDAFDALSIEPTSGSHGAICDIDRCDVRVYLRGETLGEARKRAEEARGCRGDNQLRGGRTAKSFGGCGVAGESWFGKIGTLDAKNAGCTGGGEGIRGGLNVLTDEADFQGRVQLLRKSECRRPRLRKRSWAKRCQIRRRGRGRGFFRS